jgi:hypothetical protein
MDSIYLELEVNQYGIIKITEDLIKEVDCFKKCVAISSLESLALNKNNLTNRKV